MALSDGKLRVAELLGSLSLATDLATGQPPGHGLSTSVLAVSLAREMGCDSVAVRAVQQVALLRFLGCTADAGETAQLAGGDESRFLAAMAPAAMGDTTEAIRALVGAVGVGHPPQRRARLVGAALADPGGGARSLAAHCEVGAMLSRRLGLADRVAHALEHAHERWDGKGHPAGLAGGEVPLEIRISVVARDVDLFSRRGEDASEVLRRRRGRAYDPDVVDVFNRLRPPHRDVEWEEVLAAEPEPTARVDDLGSALGAVADFVDLKSPWTRGHSRKVAELATTAARHLGAGPEECRTVGKAALVHDLGKVGVGNSIWDKPGPLSTGEWEQVRLHPYLTQRILARCEALATLGEVASSHHERLDGSGYHRQTAGEQLPKPARIVAAADSLAGLIAERPHRPPMKLDEAARLLESEAVAGRLDPAAVAAVISATGGSPPELTPTNPGGLTDREVEILRLLARGYTNRRAGEELFISPKTVGRHVENIYAKIGVTTRPGATVFAMEHRLLG